MRKRIQASQRWAAGCLGASLLLLPSCQSSQDQWTFAVSRNVYSDGQIFYVHGGHCHDGGKRAAVLAAILLLPIVLDLVILPVTLTHDLCR